MNWVVGEGAKGESLQAGTRSARGYSSDGGHKGRGRGTRCAVNLLRSRLCGVVKRRGDRMMFGPARANRAGNLAYGLRGVPRWNGPTG
jgi:hypothetical protein